MAYRTPDLTDRQNAAAAAKKQLLERFRAASQDPNLADKLAERARIHEARIARQAEREAERKAREAEQLAAMAKAEEIERLAALEAEQKAARDARYAARKAAKKVRRRGF